MRKESVMNTTAANTVITERSGALQLIELNHGRGQAHHSLSAFNWTGDNRIDPNAVAAPFDCEHAVSMSTPALAAHTCDCNAMGRIACGADTLMITAPGLRSSGYAPRST